MAESDIDVDQFKPRSVGAAVTSVTSNLSMSIKNILKAAS